MDMKQQAECKQEKRSVIEMLEQPQTKLSNAVM